MINILYKWWISYRCNKWLASQKYKQWEPLISDDEYSICTMAKLSKDIFQEEINNIISNTNSKTFIKVVYLDDEKINAFACKVGTFKKCGLYIIALNKGIFSEIDRYISRNEFKAVIDEKFHSLKNVSTADLYRISMWSISKSIMYHELAHVLRGHLDFLIDENIINANNEYTELPITGGNLRYTDEIDRISVNEKIRLCENDADAHAARLFSVNAFTFAKNINTEKKQDVYIGVYSLIIFSSHILFSIFDQTSRGNESKYPQPAIRSAIYASQFSANYSKMLPEIRFEGIYNALLYSILCADSYCNKIRLSRGKYNLRQKFKEWEVTQKPLMNDFDKVLANYNLLRPKN